MVAGERVRALRTGAEQKTLKQPKKQDTHSLRARDKLMTACKHLTSSWKTARMRAKAFSKKSVKRLPSWQSTSLARERERGRGRERDRKKEREKERERNRDIVRCANDEANEPFTNTHMHTPFQTHVTHSKKRRKREPSRRRRDSLEAASVKRR